MGTIPVPLHQRMVEHEVERHTVALANLAESAIALHALNDWLLKAEAAGIEFDLHVALVIPPRAKQRISCLVMLDQVQKDGKRSEDLYRVLTGFGFTEVAREWHSFADFVELLAPDSSYGIELEVSCGFTSPVAMQEVAA